MIALNNKKIAVPIFLKSDHVTFFENCHVCLRLVEPRVFNCTPARPVGRSEGRVIDWQRAPSLGGITNLVQGTEQYIFKLCQGLPGALELKLFVNFNFLCFGLSKLHGCDDNDFCYSRVIHGLGTANMQKYLLQEPVEVRVSFKIK